MNNNLFTAPRQDQALRRGGSDPVIAAVAQGQKLVIFALVGNLVVGLLQMQVHPYFVFLVLGTAALAITGLIKMARGLGFSMVTVVLCAILMLVPLVNLLVLVVINGKATRALRDAGYRVGLFGARAP